MKLPWVEYLQGLALSRADLSQSAFGATIGSVSTLLSAEALTAGAHRNNSLHQSACDHVQASTAGGFARDAPDRVECCCLVSTSAFRECSSMRRCCPCTA